MSYWDDALHDEREEMYAARWDREPRGRRISGTYHDNPPTRAEAEADLRADADAAAEPDVPASLSAA